MKIKVEVKPYQRKIIERNLENYQHGLISNKKRFEEEQAKLKQKIKDYVDFWANNELPVEDFKGKNARINEMDRSKCHETERVWRKLPEINISTNKQESGWVCKYCERPTATKYIATGHDHTDYSYEICDCEGAAKHGKHYSELN